MTDKLSRRNFIKAGTGLGAALALLQGGTEVAPVEAEGLPSVGAIAIDRALVPDTLREWLDQHWEVYEWELITEYHRPAELRLRAFARDWPTTPDWDAIPTRRGKEQRLIWTKTS